MVSNLLLQNLSAREALGLTIVGEARGEPINAQVAVGCVVRNRMHGNPEKYKTYNDVVFEEKQFSCWNLNDHNYPFLLEFANKLLHGQEPNDPYIRQCFWVAQGIIAWAIVDNTRNALNYITKELFESDKRPHWAKNVKNIIQHGNQVFFTA